MKLHATILFSVAMLCLAVTTTSARNLYWVGGIRSLGNHNQLGPGIYYGLPRQLPYPIPGM